MSNKPWDKLDPLDLMLRRAIPDGPETVGVQVVIRKVCGFEAFNIRPYHNYEHWGSGYEVEGGGVRARKEDLDDAIQVWAETLARFQAGGTLKPWERQQEKP